MLIKDRVERGVKSVMMLLVVTETANQQKGEDFEEKKRLEMYCKKKSFVHLCYVFSSEVASDYRISSR